MSETQYYTRKNLLISQDKKYATYDPDYRLALSESINSSIENDFGKNSFDEKPRSLEFEGPDEGDIKNYINDMDERMRI